MFEELKKSISQDLSLKAMAYIGDSVYELYSRLHTLESHKTSMAKIHQYNIDHVNAKAQAECIRKISDRLTEEEQDLVRRARNINTGAMPRNARVSDYRAATGLEALVGHLFVTGQEDRLLIVLQMLFSTEGQEDDDGKIE